MNRLKSEKSIRRFDALLYWYVVLVLAYQLLSLTFPFTFVASLFSLNRFSQGLAVVGLIFLAFDIFVTKRCLENRYAIVLWALVTTLVVSSLLLGDYGVIGNGKEASLISNAKSIVWQLDIMLVIFPYCASLDKRKALKLAKTIYWIASLVYIPCLLASFWQYGHSLGYDAIYGTSTGTRQGFQGGRLFGLMMGVFSGGVISMVLSIASACFARREHRPPIRATYIIFLLLYFLYAVLSGTRSVLVALAVTALLTSFIYCLKKSDRQGKREDQKHRLLAMPMLKSVLFCVLVLCAYHGVSSAASTIPLHNAEKASTEESIKKLANERYVLYHPLQETTDAMYPIVATYFDGELMLAYSSGSNAPFNPNSLSYFDDMEGAEVVRMGDLEESSHAIATKRTDVGESAEITNGRLAIWSDYLSVAFCDIKTALFGLSPGCYMPAIYAKYAEKGELYIIEYIEEHHPNMIANGLIYDTHNAYIAVLIQGGLLACVVLLIFAYRLATDALRAFWRQDSNGFGLLTCISIVAFIATSSFFDSELFFRTTAASVVFWALCGLIAGEVRRTKEYALNTENRAEPEAAHEKKTEELAGDSRSS